MSVGNLTNWSKNTVFDQVVQSAYESTVFRNDRFLGIFEKEESPGGESWEWRVNTDGNSSVEVFTEGAGQGAADVQDFELATLPYIFFRGTTRVTGHTRRAVRNRAIPAGGFDIIRVNIELLIEDLHDLMNVTFMGSTNNGILIAVDSAGTYAGRDRATATDWQSYEETSVGALAWADFMNWREAGADNDRGFTVDTWLCAQNQVTNIQSMPGAPGAANNSIHVNLTQSGGELQLMPTLTDTKLGEASLVGIPDFSDTDIVGIKRSLCRYIDHPEPEGSLVVREWKSGNDDVAEYSTAGSLVYGNPRKALKGSGVTA